MHGGVLSIKGTQAEVVSKVIGLLNIAKVCFSILEVSYDSFICVLRNLNYPRIIESFINDNDTNNIWYIHYESLSHQSFTNGRHNKD